MKLTVSIDELKEIGCQYYSNVKFKIVLENQEAYWLYVFDEDTDNYIGKVKLEET